MSILPDASVRRFPSVVHFYGTDRECRVAFPSRVHNEGEHRDLAVVSPYGDMERQTAVLYDAGPDPEPWTWHREDACPETAARETTRRTGSILAEAMRPAGPPLTDHQADLLERLIGPEAAADHQARTLGVRKSPHRDMPGLRITLGMAGAGSSAGLNHAADAVASDNPVWIVNQAGIAQAVIIPAEDWHEPGQCCCSNCPWNNKHETR